MHATSVLFILSVPSPSPSRFMFTSVMSANVARVFILLR